MIDKKYIMYLCISVKVRTFVYLHNEVESKQKRYDTKYFTNIVGA